MTARQLIKWSAAVTRIALRDERPAPEIAREALAIEQGKSRPRKGTVAALRKYLEEARGAIFPRTQAPGRCGQSSARRRRKTSPVPSP